LKVNSALKKINLRYNEVYYVGARAIADALKFNRALMSIDLQGNFIGETGTVRLFNVFMNAFNFAEILDDGSRAIADALNVNSSLQEIDLRKNRIGPAIMERFDQALQGCRNRRYQNYCIWMRAFIDNLRSVKILGFDNHIFAFYFYPLLGIYSNKF
jgi:hypothetical protein